MAGRLPASVYRRRRIAALVAVIAVIAIVWWVIASLVGGGGGSSAAPATTPTATSTPTAATSPASPAATPTLDPTATATPTPTPTTTPAATCTAETVSVTAATDAPSYPDGAQPQLSLVLTNTSEAPCVIDVGTVTQVYTIAHEAGADDTGDHTVWVSTHCQQQPTNELVELAPGQELAAPAVPWAREYSAPETCGQQRPPAETGSGYLLTVAIGGIQSTPISFILE